MPSGVDHIFPTSLFPIACSDLTLFPIPVKPTSPEYFSKNEMHPKSEADRLTLKQQLELDHHPTPSLSQTKPESVNPKHR